MKDQVVRRPMPRKTNQRVFVVAVGFDFTITPVFGAEHARGFLMVVIGIGPTKIIARFGDMLLLSLDGR